MNSLDTTKQLRLH